MANTGNVFPGVGDQVSTGGTPWTNPGNITADDGADATVVAAVISDDLFARVFGLAVPTGATINGITVRVEASEHSGGSETLEIHLRDSLGNVSSLRSVSLSGTTKSVYTAGSTSDLWGWTHLTPGVVNNPDFAVRMRIVTAHDVRIDFVTMAVEYTPASGAASGTATVAFTPTGSLAGSKGTLAGNSTVAFAPTATGTTTGAAALSGTAALGFSAAAATTAVAVLAGVAALAFSPQATGTRTLHAAGTAPLAFTAAATGTRSAVLVGSADLVFIPEGILKGAAPCVGQAALAFASHGRRNPDGLYRGRHDARL